MLDDHIMFWMYVSDKTRRVESVDYDRTACNNVWDLRNTVYKLKGRVSNKLAIVGTSSCGNLGCLSFEYLVVKAYLLSLQLSNGLVWFPLNKKRNEAVNVMWHVQLLLLLNFRSRLWDSLLVLNHTMYGWRLKEIPRCKTTLTDLLWQVLRTLMG